MILSGELAPPQVEIVRPLLGADEHPAMDVNRLLRAADNLQALDRLLHGDERHPPLAGQVDLVYLDPPFAVQGTFAGVVAIPLAAAPRPLSLRQPAYDDTWVGGLDAYLAMMRERLTLLRALLRPTGALYLHCDWHASHHLKLLLDEIFGADNFRNEIVWAYRSGGASRRETLPRKHDVVFLYSRTSAFAVRPQIERQYLAKPFMGSRRDGRGRLYVDTLLRDVLEGEIQLVEGERLVTYNTRPVLNLSAERTGFPTQKPLGLLRLLLRVASDPGDLVLDAFCGSGTTALAAETLTDDSGAPAPRRWIAVDNGALAVAVARKRLIEARARPFTVEYLGTMPPIPASPRVEIALETHDRTVTLALHCVSADLVHHLRALDDAMRTRLMDVLATDWPALVDSWSVAWDHHQGAPFSADWRALRTRTQRELPLNVTHTYATPGERSIAVHVTDAFGSSALICFRVAL
jgi:DNA modification methylase